MIYLNEHKNFYSRIQQSLKFISIYNLNWNLSFFVFIYELDRFDRCSELTFIFHVIYFIFESRSTTELNNFFSLFCTTSSRRLSVLDYGEFSNVSKNCRFCVVGFRSLKSSYGNSRVKYFKEFEMNKKINCSMNYYLNVSLIGSSTKNDRCQDVTVSNGIRIRYWILF